MSCDSQCPVALSGGAWVGLCCVIVVFPGHVHLPFRTSTVLNFMMVGWTKAGTDLNQHTLRPEFFY